jgi:ParB/RepB/Spo0J family partition protein
MHARFEESIHARACESLVESMRKHGQKHAVLGRKVMAPDGSGEIELIYGARRLFAAMQLGVELLVVVRDIDDRAAFIEMDLENRAREDITAYERGLNYSRWLRAGYFTSQAELAGELGISEAQVSRLLRFAELPAAVVAAFHSTRDIREEWAVSLANACRDPRARQDIARRARERTLMKDRTEARSPAEIYACLLNGSRGVPVRRDSRDEIVLSSSGQPLFRIAFRARSLHVILPREKIPGETLHRIKKEISEIVESRLEARPARRGVRPIAGSLPVQMTAAE